MTKHSWIRDLFARPVIRPIRRSPPRARPAVESLEDRSVPSRFVVANLLDGSLRWAIVQKTAAVTPQTSNPTGSDPTIVVNNPTDTPVTGETDLRGIEA